MSLSWFKFVPPRAFISYCVDLIILIRARVKNSWYVCSLISQFFFPSIYYIKFRNKTKRNSFRRLPSSILRKIIVEFFRVGRPNDNANVLRIIREIFGIAFGLRLPTVSHFSTSSKTFLLQSYRVFEIISPTRLITYRLWARCKNLLE